MLENFGARLRQRRVEQGISLSAIAQQTKIKLSLLEALERDDVSRWPSGIFRRAYIRTYAQAIGLDPDVVLREFLEVHPEPAEVFTAALESALAEDRARASSSAQSRLRDFVGSALSSLSLFRRTPAAEHPGLPARDHATPDGAFEDELEDHEPVTYPSHGLAWAETADDAGVEFPVLEEPVTVPFSNNVAANADVARVEPAAAAEERQGSRPVQSVTASAAAAPAYPDLLGLARLCTDFGRIDDHADLPILLDDAARLLDATGLIVWIWDDSVNGLRPALAHGYSEKVLAHLPTVARDADNATAAAFRSSETCGISGSDRSSGALVVPLLTQAGCAGVLAIELQPSVGQTDAVRAVATIIAALLAQLIARAYAVDADMPPEVSVPAADDMAPPVARTRFAY